MSTACEGRTALVTGAGQGLGAAMAEHLAAAGARVVLVGRRPAPLQEVASRVAAAQGQRSGQHDAPGTRCESADVSDPASVLALAAALADEEVSIVVNNAGVPGPVAPLVEVSPEEWDEVFAVNVRGTYLVCRAFLPAMVARGGGDVVNIASVSGKRPLPGRTPYCAAKMAVIGLTSTLAFEVGAAGVRVNTLSPGPVEGDRMERNVRLEAERSGTTVERARQSFVGRAALGRWVTADEVGRALVALLGMPGLSGADIDLSAGIVA